MNHVFSLKLLLEKNYQISEYILSTAQNLRTDLAIDRKVFGPWEK